MKNLMIYNFNAPDKLLSELNNNPGLNIEGDGIYN